MVSINYLLPFFALFAFVFAWLIFEKIKRENAEEKLLRLLSGHDKVEARNSLLTDNEKLFFRT